MMYKEKYMDYIIMIKVGNFYETYNDDAYILSNIIKYNVKNFNTYKRVGFPLSSLGKVKKELIDSKINYIIIEKLDVYKIVENKKFKTNNYQEYKDKSNDLFEINNRIDNISTYLKQYDSDNIDVILSKVESILYER